MKNLIPILLALVVLSSGCTKEPGCTNPQACNFSQSADEDDGTCSFPGDECSDGNIATGNDTWSDSCTCEGGVLGCTISNACNYNSDAEINDGSCAFVGSSCDDGNPNTGNDVWSDSCTCEGGVLGCTISNACNYNSDAEVNDYSCAFVGDSCDDGNPDTANDVWSDSCACESHICGNDVSHEGYYYNTVLIGDQCWFSENCKYLPSVTHSTDGSNSSPRYYVYDYSGGSVVGAKGTSNYQTYGVLYNWPAVMTEGICPNGWHIPSNFNFAQLRDFLGGENSAGNKIKSTSGWDDTVEGGNGNGSNSSGFNALPGGDRVYNDFIQIGSGADWWSSSIDEENNSYAKNYYTWSGSYQFIQFYDSFTFGHSARCVQD